MALLSDEAAAVHQTILDGSGLPPQVTVPNGSGRTRLGIVVHQRDPVDPRDVRFPGGIPCTSVDRILVDVASRYSETDLEVMLVAAESIGFLKRSRLYDLVGQRRGRAGISKLERLIEFEPAITRSGLERLFIPVFRMAGVARPRFSHPIVVPGRPKPLEVDFAWPDLRMVVEADSQRFHGDWESAERDRDRDQLLALAGWVCHRFVRRRVVADPVGAAARVRLLTDVRPAA